MSKKTCEFDGCDRQVSTRGLCSGHYHQFLRGEEVRPLRAYVKGLHRDEDGRVCTDCRKYKKWSEYYTNKSKCKPCFIRRVTENARND